MATHTLGLTGDLCRSYCEGAASLGQKARPAPGVTGCVVLPDAYLVQCPEREQGVDGSLTSLLAKVLLKAVVGILKTRIPFMCVQTSKF